MPSCPDCGSNRYYKDGVRYSNDGQVQRYLCRECGYRFRDKSNKEGQTNMETVQVCAIKDAKNLTDATINKIVAGTENHAELDLKGALAQYTAKQITLGLKDVTIEKSVKAIRMLQERGANLFSPEATFKTILAAKKYSEPKREKKFSEDPWSAGTKSVVARAYVKFCKLLRIQIPEYVDFSKFKQDSKIPWIPYEKDIDTLIHACSRKISVFLQVLKESGARSGEVFKLKWKDVDLERKFININDPEKGSLPRQTKISDKLVAMLQTLPKQGEKVWGNSSLHQIRSNFNQRKRAAFKLCNPNLKEIHFHSFRHWFASTEYHKSNDILRVKQKLGHRSINSTMVYTHLIEFESDDFISRIATTREEKLALIEAGFEYVSCDPDGTQYFRKRK